MRTSSVWLGRCREQIMQIVKIMTKEEAPLGDKLLFQKVTVIKAQIIKQRKQFDAMKRYKLQAQQTIKHLQQKLQATNGEKQRQRSPQIRHQVQSAHTIKYQKKMQNQNERLRVQTEKKVLQIKRLSNEVFNLKQILSSKIQQNEKSIRKKDQQISYWKQQAQSLQLQQQEKKRTEILRPDNIQSSNVYKRNVDSCSQSKRPESAYTNKLTETSIKKEIRRNNLKNPQTEKTQLKLGNLNSSIQQKQFKLIQKDKTIQDLKLQLQLHQKDRVSQNSQQQFLQNRQGKLESQKQLNKLQIQLKQQKEEHQKNILIFQRQLQKQKTVRRSLTKEIQRLKLQISTQLARQKQINFNLNSQVQRLRDFSQKISKTKRYESLFTGDALDQSKQCREYLSKILQEKIGLRISKTKLIYRFDPYSKSNFHQYFDIKEQLVLIVRTQNDFIFGGWTEGGFIPKAKSQKSGLLFSLTNEQCFELAQSNRKAITYDEFNIIFGNSEIAIQSLKDEVYSNFGIKNGFYNCGDYKVDVMLGAGDAKEVKIKTYEIFQLNFEK